MSDQFTVNWWEHLFNSAASKIKDNEDKKDDEYKKEMEKEAEKETINSNPLNKKSFYYSRFTKVYSFLIFVRLGFVFHFI